MTGLGVAMVPVFLIARACLNRDSSVSIFSSRSNWLRSKHDSQKWVELPEVEKSKDEECFENEKDEICLEFNQDIHVFATEVNQEISSKLLPNVKSDYILENSETFYTCEDVSLNSSIIKNT